MKLPGRVSTLTAVLCGLFFISGVSALIFETLWFRQAGLAFGNTVWASSLVLSAFMVGLCAGNGLAYRFAERLKNPVRAYAMVEIAIAVSGVGLVFGAPSVGVQLAPWLGQWLDEAWVLTPLQFGLAFMLLVVPSTAIGLTLPLLINPMANLDPHFGRVLGRLYGWNTLGAVVGVVAGELLLIHAYGVHGTALIAGGLNLIAAGTAAWISVDPSRTRPDPGRPPRMASRLHERRRPTAGGYLVAAFLAGFALLALEVVWFRFLLLFAVGSSVTFAVMLAVILAGLAFGGLAVSSWVRLGFDSARLSPPTALFAGVMCIASYAAFPLLSQPVTAELDSVRGPVATLAMAVPLMFPVSFVSGALLTLIGAALRPALTSATTTSAALILANTAGAALGSLTAGFVLLPVLGIETSLFVIALVYGVTGALLSVRHARPRTLTHAATAVFLVAAALFPFGAMQQRYLQIPAQRFMRDESGWTVAAVREGLMQTLVYLRREPHGNFRLITNSVSMSGTFFRARRYMKLFVYWPMAVHPAPQRALLIAYGVGNTAKALTDSTGLDSIDVVDTSRDILDMSDLVYPDERDRPLADPRVRVHVQDGRYFLQTTPRRFDLITGEPPPPRLAGVVNLYSREYFDLLRHRLAEGGIVTYWLPVADLTDVSTKAILRAFCEAFDDCSLWNGEGPNLMLVGTRHANGPVSDEQFARQWADPRVAIEMERLGLERPEQLGALFIGDAAYLKGLYGDSPAIVDNFPKLIEAGGSADGTDQLVRSFTDVAAARERFQRSPLIQRLWPERTAAASLPYFEFQALINAYTYEDASWPPFDLDDARVPGMLHRILTESPLRTLALWRLGSSADAEAAVEALPPQDRLHPAIQFQLGVRLMAHRQYAAAIDHLRRAETLPGAGEQAFRLRLYALAMSEQKEQAERLAREYVRARPSQASGSFWAWMKSTFAMDVGP